jgi:hypothetical protein
VASRRSLASTKRCRVFWRGIVFSCSLVRSKPGGQKARFCFTLRGSRGLA